MAKVKTRRLGSRLRMSARVSMINLGLSVRSRIWTSRRFIRHPIESGDPDSRDSTACSERSIPSRSEASTLPFPRKMYSNRKGEAREYHALQTRTRYLFVTL